MTSHRRHHRSATPSAKLAGVLAAMRSRRHPLPHNLARPLLSTGAVGRNAGWMPWPNCSPCKQNTRPGSKRCRTIYRTLPPPRRWQLPSNWTSIDLPERSCPAVAGTTDKAPSGRQVNVDSKRVVSVCLTWFQAIPALASAEASQQRTRLDSKSAYQNRLHPLQS